MKQSDTHLHTYIHTYIHTQKYNPVAEKSIVMFELIFQKIARIRRRIIHRRYKTEHNSMLK